MNAAGTKLLGRWGEAAAAEYLRKKGYRIVAAGYRTRLGEIDLIAENRRVLAFVEVKTRKNADFAQARDAVDRRKQGKIIQTAKLYLAGHETKKEVRLDVIEVYAPQGIETADPQIIHIENAFTEDR